MRSGSGKTFAQAGFVAKGIVWAVVALIAIEVARGDRRKAQDEEGAIQELANQPFGELLLIVLAVGLAGYALWRARVALLGPPGESGASAAAERVGSVVLALSYAALCFYVVRFLTESGGGGGGATSGNPDSVTKSLLDESYGVALVIGIGAVLLGVAAYEAYKAITRSFLDDLETGRMSAKQKRVATFLGTAGNAGLAVISALAGVFMVKAAIEHEPKEAVGLDGALQEIVSRDFGPLLLGLTAACVLLYAAYCLVEARYRKL